MPQHLNRMLIHLRQQLRRTHLLRGARSNHLATTQQHHTVRIRSRHIQVMKHRQHCSTLSSQLAAHPQRLLLMRNIQCRSRLIQKNQRGLLSEHTRQMRTATLTTGQGRNIAIRQMSHRRTLHHRSNHGVILFSALRALPRGAAHLNHLMHRVRKRHIQLLQQHRTLTRHLTGRNRTQRSAIQQNLTATGRNITSNHTQQSRLTGTIRTNQRHNLARSNRQRHIIQNLTPTSVKTHTGQAQQLTHEAPPP